MDELKPCPFCGGEARTFEFSWHASQFGGHMFEKPYWQVICESCKAAIGDFDSKTEAIESWNTRACEVLEGDGTGEALPEIRTCVVVKEHVDIDGERMTDYSCGCCNQSGWNHSYCPNCGAKVVDE